MPQRLLIYGAGNLGTYLHSLAAGILGHEVVGYVDAFKTSVAGRPVLGQPEDLPALVERHRVDAVVFAIGYYSFSARVAGFELVERLGVPLCGLVHPSAIVDPSCSLGAGSHVFAGCVLDRNVVLEKNVLLNVGCTIAHDTVIKEHSFLAPRVAIAGFCELGARSLVGIGTLVIDNVRTAPDNMFGAGSVVTSSIELSNGLYLGGTSPAEEALARAGLRYLSRPRGWTGQ